MTSCSSSGNEWCCNTDGKGDCCNTSFSLVPGVPYVEFAGTVVSTPLPTTVITTSSVSISSAVCGAFGCVPGLLSCATSIFSIKAAKQTVAPISYRNLFIKGIYNIRRDTRETCRTTGARRRRIKEPSGIVMREHFLEEMSDPEDRALVSQAEAYVKDRRVKKNLASLADTGRPNGGSRRDFNP